MRSILLALLLSAPSFAKDPTPPPAPEEDGGLVAEEVEEGEVVVKDEYSSIALPVDKIRSIMPATSPDGQALADAYADFMEEVLGEDEEANMGILVKEKPGELEAIETAGREIIGRGGDDAIPAAFVVANAYLHYADLGYSMKPTSRMDAEQAAKFQKMLNKKVYPLFKPVDETAMQYLSSIADAAHDEHEFDKLAKAQLAAMEAAKRPRQ